MLEVKLWANIEDTCRCVDNLGLAMCSWFGYLKTKVLQKGANVLALRKMLTGVSMNFQMTPPSPNLTLKTVNMLLWHLEAVTVPTS